MSELLPWHRGQWQRLRSGIGSGRLPHTFLCVGPVGLGKLDFAHQLARALLCHSVKRDGLGCGTCRSCQLFHSGNHPDFLRVQPAAEGKPITVDQARGVSEFLGYTSQFEHAKIALLAPADALNINAANSLLKTLEEPPSGSVLLMVTAFPSRLPVTVRSRCQRLVFRAPEPARAESWLNPRLSPEFDPALLLRLVDGAPLAALALADQECLARRQELFAGLRDVMLGKADPVLVAESWVKGDVGQHLRWLTSWHMDMIRLKMAGGSVRLVNEDLRAPLASLAVALPARALFQRLDAVAGLLDLMSTQVNTQILFEAFLGSCVGERRDCL